MNIKEFTFLSGLEKEDGTLLIAAQENQLFAKGLPHTHILVRSPEGEWNATQIVGWASASVSKNETENKVVAVDAQGEFLEGNEEKMRWTGVLEDSSPPFEFRFIKCVDGVVYAGGTDRHIFQRIAETEWDEISHDQMHVSDKAIGFETITGFKHNELYAMGWNGEIWTNKDGDWKQVSSPTKLILTDAAEHDGLIYACGQLGKIIVGRGETWEEIPNTIVKEDLWSVCSYGDAVYFAGDFGILKYQDSELSLATMINTDMRTANNLFTGPSGLWSVGATDIAVFDGVEWRAVE